MKKYDYSFLKTSIPGNIFGLSNILTDLKAKEGFRKIQSEKAFEALRKKAIVESVKGSNAIEGIVTTDSRLNEIVAGSKAISHSEKEISGYRDALNYIHSNYGECDLSEEFIKALHRFITAENAPDEAGHYKNRDNLIMEYNADGTRRIRFKPVSFKETENAMEQLILAYIDARQDPDIPDLLLIPCVILDFLCIHPFNDGNGRVSRLLSVFLLYNHGYDIGRYISVESKINEYKEAYYNALESSSENWHANKNDYIPFITYFLQILYKCYKELDDSFMDIALKKAKKSERIEAVVMNAVVPVSKAEIASKLPDIAITSVEKTLSDLTKAGKIKKIGTYKNARYFKA